PMHYLLVTVGSSGDVHPFVGIGRTLAARGHRVTLLTSRHFEPLVCQAGLEFVGPAPQFGFVETLSDPRLWHPLRRPRLVLRLIAQLNEPTFQPPASLNVPGDTVVAGSSLAFGARVAQEVLGLPLATVHLSPSIFRSVHAEVKLPGLLLADWVPKPLKRLQF